MNNPFEHKDRAGHSAHERVEEEIHKEHVREEEELHREHVREEERLHEAHVREEELLHDELEREEEGGGCGAPYHPTEIILTVVVNGEPVKLMAPLAEPLEWIVPAALEKAGVFGRPPEDWEIKDKDGNLYDRKKPIGSFEFTCDSVIFLSLRAGEAG